MGRTPSSKSSIEQPTRSRALLQRYLGWGYAFWKFSRPHTIVGTSLSVLSLYLVAGAIRAEFALLEDWQALAAAWIACLCGNIYIVGLNQLEDIGIDQINKPHLPLASGEFSRRQARTIVVLTGAVALLLAFLQGPWLLAMVSLSLIIGTAYSLPPIRLKRFPFWAALCIFVVRGVIVNLGLFLHFSWVANAGLVAPELMIPPAVWALTWFILGFTLAIAIFKDIPDIEGDRQYQIRTLTLRLGGKTVFNLARWVITVCYLGMASASWLGLPGVNSTWLSLSHLLALSLFWIASFKVDLQDKRSIAQFYQLIWKLFFLEYLIFPLACFMT